jgi:hypothetical protein
MDATERKRLTEARKRLGDVDRAFMLSWVTLYYEVDGRARGRAALIDAR